MSSMRLVRTAGHAMVACLAAVACLWALPAHAADVTVRLLDADEEHPNRFDPDELTVAVGDTITWRWAADNQQNHGVRVDRVTEEGTEQVYESHEGCEAISPEACGAPGESQRWAPSEPGDYTFYCPVHGSLRLEGQMTGTLTVEPAPPPSPEPSPTGSETKEDEASPEPSPTTTKKKRKAERDTNDGGSSSSSSSSSSSPRTSQGTAGDPGISYGPPEPMSPEPPPTILPSVAPSQSPTPDVDEPELEEFPAAAEPSPTEGGAGLVAVDAPRDGPSPRSVWLGIGSASLLASAGAFLKLVLFGASWT